MMCRPNVPQNIRGYAGVSLLGVVVQAAISVSTLYLKEIDSNGTYKDREGGIVPTLHL